MNLFELRTTEKWTFHLEFHPRLTVISGLQGAHAARMANMISQAMRGKLSGSQLVITHDGKFQRIDDEVLAELGLNEFAFDPVFRQRELPGARPVREPEKVDERPAAEREADEPQIEYEVRRRHGLGTLPKADAEGVLQNVWHQLEASWSRREFARASAPAVRDPLPSRVDTAALQEGLAQATAALDAFLIETQEDERSDGIDSLAAQVAALEDERRLVSEELSRLEAAAEKDKGAPTRAVEVALQRVDAARRAALNPAPLPEAIELADRLASVEAQINSYPKSDVPAWLRKQALEALESAQARLTAAEAEGRAASVTQEQKDAVEARHIEVIAARQNEHKRIGAAGSKRRIDEALAAESEALEEVGARTYEGYRLLIQAFGDGAEAADEHIATARRALLDAQQVIDELDSPEPNPAWTKLLEERDAIRSEAEQLLGGPVETSELEAALRAMKGEPRSIANELNNVREALIDVDVYTDDEADIEATARSFIQRQIELAAEYSQRQVQIRSLTERVHEIVALKADAEDALAETESASVAESEHKQRIRAQFAQMEADVAEREAQLHKAFAQNAELEAALAQRQKVDTALSEAEAAYEKAKKAFIGAQEGLRTERDAKTTEERAWEAAGADYQELDLSRVNLIEADRVILARVAQQRYVGSAGSLPLICTDILSGLPSDFVRTELALLQRLSSVVQIVYTTDNEEITRWAESLGPDFAAVRRFSGT